MITRPDEIPMAEIVLASRRDDVVRAMQQFYADLDARIAAHQPTCSKCGRCCQFGAFGHRLFATSLEFSYYRANAPNPLSITADACPHIQNQQCQARDYRPIGCRIFFCDPPSQDWQGPLMEFALRRLRTMHEQLDVPYVYADWMDLLRVSQETART